MDKVRLLYIFVNLEIGGAEEHLLTVLKKMDRERFEATVCCIGKKGRIGEEIERLGYEVISLDRMKRKSFDPRVIFGLVRLMKIKDIQVVHAHLYHASLYGRLAAWFAGVPVVVTVHNIYTGSSLKLRRRLLNRWLSGKTDRLIAVSHAVRSDILNHDGISSEKVQVIYNGIDSARFNSSMTQGEARRRVGIPDGRFWLGIVARLDPQKGHTFLLDAIRKCLDQWGDSLSLLVVGKGGEEARLKEQAASLGLQDRVFWMGARRDIPEILRALDLFVMPSLWEGLPLSLLEALASGLPVIATSVGGVGEVIEHGKSGLLISPKNVDELASSIHLLYLGPEQREALGAGGLARVMEMFSQDKMVSELFSLYRKVGATR